MNLPTKEEINLFVNAVQLCIKSKIQGVILPKTHPPCLTIHFDKVDEKDDKLQLLNQLLGEHTHLDDNSLLIYHPTSESIALLTQFLQLTRLEKTNMLKIAELDSRYQPFIKKLNLRKNNPASQQLDSIEKVIKFIFEEVEKQSLTLRELSEKTGLTQMTINNLKSGRDIRFSNLLKILNVLNLKLKIE